MNLTIAIDVDGALTIKAPYKLELTLPKELMVSLIDMKISFNLGFQFILTRMIFKFIICLKS